MASRLAVEAPDLVPLPGGLLNVANVVYSTDPHIGQGVAYADPGLCAPVDLAPETCWTTFDVALGVGGKVFTGFDDVPVATFGVYKGVRCWLAGEDDYAGIAQQALSLGETIAVERGLQTAVLDDDPTDDIVTGPTGPVTALAVLEGWAVTQFATRPVIHVGRYGAVWLGSKGLLKSNLDGTLETINGTPVVNGGGYDWDAAGGGTFDTFSMCVTAQVNLWGGPVTTSLGQNRTLNTQDALAERIWSVSLACPTVGKITVTTLTERLPEP